MADKKILSFRDLDTWKIAMDLAVAAYEVAGKLPPNERYELSSQIRRAAVSVPANVAEGHAGGGVGRYIYHLRIALGSLGELQTGFEIAHRLHLVSDADLRNAKDTADRVAQLLHGLLRAKRAQRLKNTATGSAFLSVVTMVGLGIHAFTG